MLDRVQDAYQAVNDNVLSRMPMEAVAVGAIAKVESAAEYANRVGQEAEVAVNAAYDIGSKTPFLINGRARIADGLNDIAKTISEVKNVGYQYYSTQLKDYVDYASQAGLQFQLFVRNSTKLSPQLQQAIDQGKILLGKIPGL